MPPLIEAHRGDSSNAPENTIAAFALALRLGVARIELDIHPCKDGTLMV
ncbi:MAG: glycerophosphodiester phosphodiesterase, partial [Terrimicrobiaceae bacterium]